MLAPISEWSPRSSSDADDLRASGLSAGHDEDVRVAHQLERLERAVGQRRAAEREIELAGLDEGVEVGVGRRLREPELDSRPVREEAPHDAGEDARADRLVGADPERPRLAGAERGDVGPRRVEPRDDRLGVAEQEHPCLGERDRARTAGPLDERLADDALERRDLLADGRLGVAEPLGRATERPFARDCVEGGEVAHLDSEPLIRLSDRCHENLDLS